MKIHKGQPRMIRMELDADQDADDARRRMMGLMRQKFPGARSITFRTIKGVCEVFAQGGPGQRPLEAGDESDFDVELKKVKKLKKPKKDKS